MRKHISFLVVAALVLAAAGHPRAARADLMAACTSEVDRFCADVDRGRGRVTACLASHMRKLGSGCLPEVEAATRSRLVPGSVRKIFDPGFRADVPPACDSAVASLCPGVTPGDGRVFACLYARTDRVDAACSAEVEETLEQAN